jgi:protein TonB
MDSAPVKIAVAETLSCNKLIRYVRAVYPAEARGKRVQGTVTMNGLITRTGEIRDLEVVKGDPLLIPAALSAARQWRYSPCIVNSEAVEVKTSIDIDFTLSQ